MQPDLNDLMLFMQAVDAGSITHAAARLGKPKSSISRRLDRLETQLSARLLERNMRGLQLTDAGHVLIEHCRLLMSEATQAVAAVSHFCEAPRGHLKISVPFTFGQLLLAPLITKFMEQYPEVSITMELENRRADIIREDFDLAIRVGRLEDSSLIARWLGHSALQIYASATYLAEHGRPGRPEDIAEHVTADFRTGDGPHRWSLTDGERTVEVDIAARFAANDPSTLCTMAVDGFGLVMLPAFIGEKEVTSGRLVRVLNGWQMPGGDFYAVFQSRKTSLKVRAFVDFIVAHLARRPYEPLDAMGGRST